ncbi:MAG: hypothetical protein ACE3JK_10545 [Sporolactobacillus sp.]
MRGFIEITDQGDYRHLININQIEPVCEGDDGVNDGANVHIIGGENTLIAQEPYDAVKRKIEMAQDEDEDEPSINTEAVGFMVSEEKEDDE